MSRIHRQFRALFLFFLVAIVGMGCATGPEPRHTPYLAVERPADAPPLDRLRAGPVLRSNASIQRDFFDLVFEAEGGVRFERLNKLKQPIGVVFETERFESHRGFVSDFLAELRDASEIDIQLATSAEDGARFASRIHFRFVSFGEMDVATPTAQCVFSPGVAPFRQIVEQGALYKELSQQIAATDTTVYIPVDRTPSEVRECVYEEITQALGPRNDLLHLSGSIFNDENGHARPTAFDLLILRALYDPRLRPLDSRATVEIVLPQILAEINPAGEQRAGRPLARRPALETLYLKMLHAGRMAQARESVLDQARERFASLPAYDYRPLVFEALAARMSKEVEVAVFNALAEKYETTPLNDPLRATLMRRYQVRALGLRKEWEAIRRLAPPLIQPLARAGRDADVAAVSCTLARADAAADAVGDVRRRARSCVLWARYAFGADHRYTLDATKAFEDFL